MEFFVFVFREECQLIIVEEMIELEKLSLCYPTVIINTGKAHQKILKSLGEMLFRNKAI